jgi:hypothetical protein
MTHDRPTSDRRMRHRCGWAAGVLVFVAAVGLGVAVQDRPPGGDLRQADGPPTPSTTEATRPPSDPSLTTTSTSTTTSIEPTPFHHAHPPWTIPTFIRLSTPLFSPTDRAELYRAGLAEADCMWTHGIPDWPEPNPRFGDGHTHTFVVWGPPGTDMDPNSPVFAQATAACRTVTDAAGLVQGKAYDDQPSSQSAK